MFGIMNEQSWADLRSRMAMGREIIRKATTVGRPLKDQVDGGGPFAGAFSPLVPEDIEHLYSSETFGEEDLVLSKILFKKDAKQTQVQVTVVLHYGDDDMQGFVGEGAIPGTERASFERRVINIKFIGVMRDITQQAMATFHFGGLQPGGAPMVSRSALALESSHGVKSLAKKFERALFDADSSIYDFEFDGIRRQIMETGVAGQQVHDLRGEVLTLQRLIQDIARLRDAPIFAKIDTVLVSTSVWSTLSNPLTNQGRTDFIISGMQVYFNKTRLILSFPGGRSIEVKTATLIDELELIGTGSSGAPSGAANTLVPTDLSTPPNAASKFTSADINGGTLYYRLRAYFAKGYSNPTASIQVTGIAAGDEVRIDQLAGDAALVADTTNPLIFYKVYRGTTAGGERFAFRAKPNTDGTNSSTRIVDLNDWIPGTSTAYALQTDKDAMALHSLMGAVRFPLGPVQLSQPFVVARFETPFINHRARQIVYLNVAKSLDTDA